MPMLHEVVVMPDLTVIPEFHSKLADSIFAASCLKQFNFI